MKTNIKPIIALAVGFVTILAYGIAAGHGTPLPTWLGIAGAATFLGGAVWHFLKG